MIQLAKPQSECGEEELMVTPSAAVVGDKDFPLMKRHTIWDFLKLEEF